MNQERGRIRSHYQGIVRLIKNSQLLIETHAKDISLNGIYIEGVTGLLPDDRCNVDVLIGMEPNLIHLKITGHVIRNDESGTALTFDEMDLDTFEHLKKLVLYNSEDPDDVLGQCHEKEGFKL